MKNIAIIAGVSLAVIVLDKMLGISAKIAPAKA